MTKQIKLWKWQAKALIGLLLLAFVLAGCSMANFSESAGQPPAEVLPQEVLARTGDVEKGRSLFMGNTHFEREGPPCMGCHSVGENGLLGGGALGPNLTNVTSRRNQSEILAILGNQFNSSSPVMKPIYADAPLSAQEQADLLTFLEASAGGPEVNMEWIVVGISVAGFLGGVTVLGFVYRNRLRGVRRKLVRKAQEELL